MSQLTSLDYLKAHGHRLEDINLSGHLRNWVYDKGFKLDQMKRVGATYPGIGRLLSLLVRTDPTVTAQFLKFGFKNLHVVDYPGNTEDYIGQPEQTQSIDLAVSLNPFQRVEATFSGRAASSTFNVTGLDVPEKLRSTPIAIVGAGASGILLYYMLRHVLGFNKISWFDKKGEQLGIWGMKNVANGTRNNPLNLTYQTVALQKAPGGGDHVVTFLRTFGQHLPAPQKVVVDKIVPSTEFQHRLYYGEIGYEFPIIINCAGIGSPREANDPSRMKTELKASGLGLRWQQQLTREQVQGQRLLFVGLGNSTAEMLVNLQKLQDEGVEVKYDILTHYSEQAVLNPDYTTYRKEKNGVKLERVFRDLTVPNLVDYHGDLAPFREAYFRALNEDRIHPGVREWGRYDDGDSYWAMDEDRYDLWSDHVDQVFTLIGYQHTAESYAKFGCRLYHGEPGFDYDGEMHGGKPQIGRGRLYPGYFGFGSILETQKNPNAIVIPGMLFRLHDLLVTLVLRAFEYQIGLGAL